MQRKSQRKKLHKQLEEIYLVRFGNKFKENALNNSESTMFQLLIEKKKV